MAVEFNTDQISSLLGIFVQNQNKKQTKKKTKQKKKKKTNKNCETE